MKSRWSVLMALGLVLISSGPAVATEPYLDFVRALRDRDYHEYALLYLDQLAEKSDVPAEIRQVIPFEKALTLLDGARNQRNPEAQSRQYDQARALLEQFLAASPNHPQAGQANTELAQVHVGKGKVEVLQSKSPNHVAQKAEFQKRARAQFAEARKVFQAAHDRFKTEYEKFDKFIPQTEKARYEARERVFLNYIQAQLNLAVLIYEEAQTYDRLSDDNRRQLTEASNAFEQIHARYRSQIAGLYARMWQGKCFEEQDDITKALGIYEELLGHGGGDKPTGALKKLQDRVRLFELICLNHEKRHDHQVVIQKANAWIKENRNLLSSKTGIGIQWELVRAEEALAKREESTEAEKNRLLQQALTTARAVNRYPGEYRDVSTAMIQRLMVALEREPGDPRDFATAFGVARNLIDDISRRNKAIAEARGPQQQQLLADLQPVLREAARILNLGLALVTPKDDPKDLYRARYFLAYIYYSLRDYSYDSAVLSEWVARRLLEKQPDLSLEAAYLAQAAWIQAYNQQPERDREYEIGRIIAICNFLSENWPNSDKAHDARMNLGSLFTQMRRPAEAARQYLLIPENAPQHLEAQLAAGSAFWLSFLEESILPEAERKPAEQLDELVRQARAILQEAITKYESQLPKELAQVDLPRLASLTRAKLTYSQILNGSGDYQGALTLLQGGALSAVAAVAAEGEERQRPPQPHIRSRAFASLVHQQVLRSYVGTQELDKARGEMKELEKIEGAGGGGAALTRIYLDLGRELEKEVRRLQAARDRRLSEVLKSFETFLDDMSNRKEGQDYSSLMWVAETYRALGEGLEAGDDARAEGYFGRAVAALQTILDEDRKSPGYIPAGAASGVQLRKVMCLRRQKKFDEALALVREILKERPKALDAQIEAAQVYQDWASQGPDQRGKWKLAIDGDQQSKKKKPADRVIWGWFGIGQRLETSLRHGSEEADERQNQYFDAQYNVAWCRLQEARNQTSDKERGELLALAKRDVVVTASLNPDLGGSETWTKFNALYREIQKELIDAGLQKEALADLEIRVRQSPGEKAADGSPSRTKKTAKAKTAKADGKPAEAAAKPESSGGVLGWIVMGVLSLAGCGAAAYFALGRKPGKPVIRVTEEEPTFGIEAPPRKTPSTRSKA